MKKRALVSVFDKSGIIEFCRSLSKMDWEIVSTGGTYSYLKENGLSPLEISQVTHTEEMFDGRVKTLHPNIHGGILYRRDDQIHLDTLAKHQIKPIDMVVNNLYPFQDKLRQGVRHEEMVENIDIGGPSMIRAAAKNYKDVIVLTDPRDYHRIIEELIGGRVSDKLRLELARKAFSYTAHYDALIANYFNELTETDYPDYLVLPFELGDKLRYGENPHQSGAFYKDGYHRQAYKFSKLHGKDLSYNNQNDIYGAIRALKEFSEPAAVGVKHTNPSGIGIGSDIYEAYIKAYEADSQSIFGGIFALNRELDARTAAHMAQYFLEIIIAPSYSDEAFKILSQKKNLRLIKIEGLGEFDLDQYNYKQVLGGMIIQEKDKKQKKEEEFDFTTVTKRQASAKELKDLSFAWQCVKNVASNGVVLARDGMTTGIGQGEVRRSWAVEEAIERAGDRISQSVLASDAFFFEDTVEALHKAGVKAMISPGGSIKDQAVIDLCNKYDMTLIFTGIRHFRH